MIANNCFTAGLRAKDAFNVRRFGVGSHRTSLLQSNRRKSLCLHKPDALHIGFFVSACQHITVLVILACITCMAVCELSRSMTKQAWNIERQSQKSDPQRVSKVSGACIPWAVLKEAFAVRVAVACKLHDRPIRDNPYRRSSSQP